MVKHKDKKVNKEISEVSRDVEKRVSTSSKEVHKYFGLLVVGFVLGILLGAFFLNNSMQVSMAPEKAGQKAVEWISDYFTSQGEAVNVELINATETEEGVYELLIKLSGAEGEVEQSFYISKDGTLFGDVRAAIPTGRVIEFQTMTEEEEEEVSTGITKSDRPNVKLFIMSYCPYGLQAQKAYMPVYDLLKEKADITVNFVDYAMHGKQEIDENLRQYCIQLEQENKYSAYAICFATSSSGDYEGCLASTGIDIVKMSNCIERIDAEYNITNMYNDKDTWASGYYPLFNVEADLNTLYGVRGSPTFVINDQVVSLTRSPEAIKEAICSAFNTPPEECEQVLSETATSAGFGGGTGSNTNAQC